MAFPPMGVRRCVFIKLSGGALNLYYHRSLEMSIVHKQKIPEPGRKRRPDRGFLFNIKFSRQVYYHNARLGAESNKKLRFYHFYFICTPSIARPRMPA